MPKNKIIKLRDEIWEKTQDWTIEDFYELQAELETVADSIFASQNSLYRQHRALTK